MFPDVVAFVISSWLQAWSNGVSIPGLHLPEVNPFVPDDLSLLPVEGPREGLPVVLLEDAGVRLWQRTDLRFENPKATIVLDFQVRVEDRREGVLHWVWYSSISYELIVLMGNLRGVCGR